MSKIIGIGANVYDTLITVPFYPAEDTKLRVSAVKECGGGPCATGLVTAAKLGADAAYVGALADDAGGKFLLNDMKRFGMSVEYTDIVKGKSSFSSYVLLSEGSASRTCVFNKDNLPEYVLDDKKIAAIKSADLLMIDGNDMKNAIKGADVARESGKHVLYDAGGLYDGVENLIGYADILIPSEEYATAFTGKMTADAAARELYERYRPEVVVVTCGVRGGIMYDGKDITAYPAFEIDAADTNGAGDVFHGAFAFAVTSGLNYFDSCIFSSAVSALKCTKFGARDAVPNLKTTINFLKERGYDEFEKNME